MLVLSDLSGIQDYLFHVRETGGRQAKALRFRSLYIQLIAEAVGLRLLRAARLGEDQLVFCAAGKLAIDCSGISVEQNDALRAEAHRIETWLRNNTHGKLRLTVVICSSPGEIVDRFRAASARLREAALRAWSTSAVTPHGWKPDLLLAGIPDPDEEAERDARLGRSLVNPKSRFLSFSDCHPVPGASFDVVGLTVSLSESEEGHSCVRSLARLARYIPTDSSGQAIDFAELAVRARGASLLAVLKADADSLGLAISRCMDKSTDLEPLRVLSRRLEDFFAQTLDHEMRNNMRWKNLYTVFSGGDDVLLVGPWDIVFDFAGSLQNRFEQEFKGDGITISAGISLLKPKFPIRLAAHQAEDALYCAKTEKAPRAATSPKDQCAAMGQIWKWSDHESILREGKQLADWVDAGVIQRGWLHTLLELALLRHGEQPGHNPNVSPEMATSRLAYHVGRNWPKPNAHDPQKSAARRWVDKIVTEFDRLQCSHDVSPAYLPTILRYALLATRAATKEMYDEQP